MKKKLVSLLIVACMVFAMFPVSAFAAESYGIYVGGTEVTTANYKNITGKGISGKVSYKPAENVLVLENATITGYYDMDPGVGDLYGILSLRDTLSIKTVGNTTVRPAITGTKPNCVCGIASTGELKFVGTNAHLIVDVTNGVNNYGIIGNDLCPLVTGLTVKSGDTATGSSYGIYASNSIFSTSGPRLTVTSGNAPAGDSIAICSDGGIEYLSHSVLTARSGNAAFSCGIYVYGHCSLKCDAIVSSATSFESDSIGIYAEDKLDIEHISAGFHIASGKSDKYSSFGIWCNKNATLRTVMCSSGSAPNASSVGVYSAEGLFTNYLVIQSGSGIESIGVLSGALMNISDAYARINAGASSDNFSIGVLSEGDLTITDSNCIIQGINYGAYAEGNIRITKVFSMDSVFIGNDYAVNKTPIINVPWAGNGESIDPTLHFHDHAEEPLTDAQQYKYIRFLNGDLVPPTPFADIPEGAYYIDPVLWAVENGITQGTGPITFSPDDTCTRAQTVTFLWRNAGCPEPESTEMPFTDVKEADYFYDAVLWAVENDITVGTSDTTFSPEDTVTRAQVVTFMWRQEGSPEMELENPFTDVPESEYYCDAVLWAVENGITLGTGGTFFSPDEGCTRAQIVTFLWRQNGEPAVNN